MTSESLLPVIKDDHFIINKIVFQNYTTPFELKEFKIPIPPQEDSKSTEPILIKPDEILIKVKGASLNPVDLLLKHLAFKKIRGSTDKPIGIDFSGIIAQIGSDAHELISQKNDFDGVFAKGDSIYGSIKPSGIYSGCIGDYIITNVRNFMVIGKIPKGLDFIKAASLPVVTCTSFEVLNGYKYTSLKGKNILVLGAGTSIGYFTVQFAKKYFECNKVITTCSSTSSNDIIEAGADLTIDYNKGSKFIEKELLEFVEKNGKFDLIYDAIRDSNIYSYLDKILKSKQDNGYLALILGSTTMNYEKMSIFDFIPNYQFLKLFFSSKLRLNNFNFSLISATGDKLLYSAIKKLYDNNELKIRIDSVYSLTDINEAAKKLSTGKAKGKIILKID